MENQNKPAINRTAKLMPISVDEGFATEMNVFMANPEIKKLYPTRSHFIRTVLREAMKTELRKLAKAS
jgi:hypothetical protein